MSPWRLICLHRTESTSTFARAAADRGLPEFLAVFADEQTLGRGRLGRRWEAPGGRAILCSTLWRRRGEAVRSGTLAQATGVAAVRTLGALASGIALKWPNDVLIGDEKAGGILIENVFDGDGREFTVVGIGLNVNQTPHELPPTEYPATSLAIHRGRPTPREPLAARLLDELAAVMDDSPLAVYGEWRAHLSTLGRRVRIVARDREITGVARDVELDGTLVIRTDTGADERFTSGEVSLRVE